MTLAAVAQVFGTRALDGVPDPWGTPWLILIDTVRLVELVLCAVVVVCAAVALVNHQTARWQKVTWVGAAVAAWSIAETEVDHVGLGVGNGGRLWFNLVALACFAYVGPRLARKAG